MATSTIKKTAPTIISETYDLTGMTSTSLIYTGVSFTIPAKSAFCVYVKSTFQTSRPSELYLCSSSTYDPSNPNYSNLVFAHADGYALCPFCGYTPSNITLYAWAKWATNGGNGRIIIDGAYWPV